MKLSPNRGPRYGWTAKAVVIHVTEGGGQGALSWLLSPESNVSAHFLVLANGRVEQLVPLDEAAYHAGRVVRPVWPSLIPGVNPNLYTIGIEIEGVHDQAAWPEAQVGSVLKIVKALGLPVVAHRDICGDKPCPGTFPMERLASL